VNAGILRVLQWHRACAIHPLWTGLPTRVLPRCGFAPPSSLPLS
jgi:hypothetical protein